MCHVYEQEFGDKRVLLAQNNFLLVVSKHWQSCLTGEKVRLYNVFQTLGFENINCHFSTGKYL